MPREKPIYADRSMSTEGLRKFLRCLKDDEVSAIKEYMKDRRRDLDNRDRPPIQA
jgi:hypothetical protein